jgi:RNA polymerase sigma factor (sigma-70 family)
MLGKINTLEKQKKRKSLNKSSDGLDDNQNTNKKVSERLARLINLAKTSFVSIDTQINDSEKSTLSDVIPDTKLEDPNESITRVDDYDLIRNNLNDLNEREKQIITNRFGLDEETPLTLIEIANKMSLTKERVRQIEEYAIIKLRRLFYACQGDNRFICPT